jgi:hypothetical protein
MRPSVGNPSAAHIEHRGERRDAGDIVHHDAAREVEHPPLGHDPASPDHVHEREVDEDQPAREKQHVRGESHPVREGAGDERRSDNGEHHLVAEEHEERDRIVGG